MNSFAKKIIKSTHAVPNIFFDVPSHTYTDNRGNTYVSVTTLLDKYGVKFERYKMAKACEAAGKRGNPKYKGKTANQLLVEWDRLTKEALEDGNQKHDYLEESVKSSNGYERFKKKLSSGRIYTIHDIISNPDHGYVDLDYFITTGVKDRYPLIYRVISEAANNGYRFYPEVCTFSDKYLISGLIDLLMVKDDRFIIGDWKTNKYPLMFESGYFEKDKFGRITNNFVYTNQYFKYPLNRFYYSNGFKYTFQLSLYAYLTERFGIKNNGCLLFHINKPNKDGVEIVKPYVIDYKKQEMAALLKHYNSTTSTKSQTLLFNT